MDYFKNIFNSTPVKLAVVVLGTAFTFMTDLINITVSYPNDDNNSTSYINDTNYNGTIITKSQNIINTTISNTVHYIYTHIIYNNDNNTTYSDKQIKNCNHVIHMISTYRCLNFLSFMIFVFLLGFQNYRDKYKQKEKKIEIYKYISNAIIFNLLFGLTTIILNYSFECTTLINEYYPYVLSAFVINYLGLMIVFGFWLLLLVINYCVIKNRRNYYSLNNDDVPPVYTNSLPTYESHNNSTQPLVIVSLPPQYKFEDT